RACTSWSPTSSRHAPSWSDGGRTSARSGISSRASGCRVRILKGATTTRSPISGIPTATAGCCRRSGAAGPECDGDRTTAGGSAQMTIDRPDELVGAAMAGEQSAFAALTERHRRELHVHCYRMLASFDDADDAVQETFLRAWQSRDSFDGSSLFRAWLYRIATNVCLDMLRRSSRRLTNMHSVAEVSWLQPYPDRLLDEVAPSDDQPDVVAVERETI